MARKKDAGDAPTPAVAALTRADAVHTLHRVEIDDGHTAADAVGVGERMATALGVEPARVFKTLMVQVPDGSLAACVVPVSGRLDLRAAAKALGAKKAVMADREEAERRTGYVRGGISPFGQRQRCPVLVDESVLNWATVFVSGGQRGLDIEIAPADLVRVADATVAPIERGP
ncbi:aminoacyl-tRNA deacylase [Micrococcus sp. HMSC067E09]|uniref:Cys-tRNA(Pro) deacylase n=1 Tax=Micrococcus sp. HMSC067E09 TaxID=1739367 RepID=UPI0008A23D38|nr:Cys-tRNA(Pro) deacylase [Micrococcus sp. HMSC067E09]OFR90480.1 aminoacyl-tRNA deacylase [Micrococcus sp. HMSC067E09]